MDDKFFKKDDVFERMRASPPSPTANPTPPFDSAEDSDVFDRMRRDTANSNPPPVIPPEEPFSTEALRGLYPPPTDKKGEVSITQEEKKNLSKEIFVVHGHDGEMKEATARVISKLDLEPTILHEKPNEGKTIIEKFEKNADVQFAVILLSPDDVGRSAKDDSDLKLRARQNVIFELGYFVGKLGRERVFVLKKDDVEVPTDFSGVVYTPYDAQGSWRMDLVRELQAVGYKVDANKVI